MLQETKLNKEEGIKLDKKLGSQNVNLQESKGASGGLGMIQNPKKVILNILNSNNSWMSSRVRTLKTNIQFILVNIYGQIYNID